MAYVFTGDNPSQLYMDALTTILREGSNVAPRGKRVLEIRPAIFEFTNPRNRVTFLKGRLINPFFQLAEALWIIAGRADVEWLTDYNKSIAQFSDDGRYFNAPYGERLRKWNESEANSFILNPIDQLEDVYRKIIMDKDTRQAVAVIYNPMFDHANKVTNDRPCNLVLTFKVRKNALDLTVFNRSNDLHWGVFGANLCQFSTIQELMASWLGVDVGTYYHITDSLHVYLDDYGSSETGKILTAYKLTEQDLNLTSRISVADYSLLQPFINCSKERTNTFLDYYFASIDPIVRDRMTYTRNNTNDLVVESLFDWVLSQGEYSRTTILAMVAYQAHKNKAFNIMYKALNRMPNCQWKVSCLRFLSKSYLNSEMWVVYQNLYIGMSDPVRDYIERTGE